VLLSYVLWGDQFNSYLTKDKNWSSNY